ncbi:MAG: carbohydrate ABC transporter permease [Bacilli bacterium]|jgi:multiple sugar transport system permease protein
MLEYKKDGLKASVALMPTLLLMAVFTFWPIFRTLVTAFMEGYNTNMSFIEFFQRLGSSTKLTLRWFKDIFVIQDGLFLKSLRNTFEMAIISVPISIIVSLFIAVALNGIKKGQGILQTIFFLPYVTNSIALGMVFSFIFSSNYGLINALIEAFGGEPQAWIFRITSTGAQPTRASILFVLMVYTVWNGLAFKIIVFLSGLQSIDKQYYQAAQIDGASRWTVFRRITVPLLSPMILYITITSLIGAFKAYNSVIAIFGHNKFGPSSSPNEFITVVGFIYKYLPLHNNTNYLSVVSAGSLILFSIIMLITLIQFYVGKKRVHY